MASQENAKAVALSISEKQSPVRLLELPPDLLLLIESSLPTNRPVLRFKAASSGSSTSTDENQAVLCTATQTYQIRHVHSSNSIFLLQPTSPVLNSDVEMIDGKDSEDNGDELLKRQGVQITSTCTSYLELIAYTPDVNVLLRKSLGIYAGPDSPLLPSPITTMKKDVEATVPSSEAEFKAAWEDIDAFEHEGQCLYLDPEKAIHLFSLVMTVTRAEGVDLWHARDEGIVLSDVVDVVRTDEECRDWARGAMERVLMAVCRSEMERDGSFSYYVDKEKMGSWVGRRLLEAQKSAMPTKEFAKLWETVLPPECTSFAKLDLIKEYFEIKEDSIRYVEKAVVVNKSVKAATSKKGKWHERFQGSKKR